MGLDQFLSKKTYVKNWEHQPKDREYKVTIKKGGKVMTEINPERISYIEEEVAYWRKANAIHKWFVDNCQEGNDNCQEHYVEAEKLKALLEIVTEILTECKLIDGKVHNGTTHKANGETVKNMEKGKIMTNPEIAEQKLPSESGFFFGNTDYDQYYYQDLQYTKKTIEGLLAEKGESGGEYYYHSSW